MASLAFIVIYKGSLTMQDSRFPRKLGLLDPCKALCSFKTSGTINLVIQCHIPKDPNPLIIYCSNLPFVICREIKLQNRKEKLMHKCKDFPFLCLSISLKINQLWHSLYQSYPLPSGARERWGTVSRRDSVLVSNVLWALAGSL